MAGLAGIPDDDGFASCGEPGLDGCVLTGRTGGVGPALGMAVWAKTAGVTARKASVSKERMAVSPGSAPRSARVLTLTPLM